jgi:hypothetical protein
LGAKREGNIEQQPNIKRKNMICYVCFREILTRSRKRGSSPISIVSRPAGWPKLKLLPRSMRIHRLQLF